MAKIYYQVLEREDLREKNFIKKYNHPVRNELHNLSRLALCNIVNYIDGQKIELNQLTLKGHNCITNFPKFQCSLSHSKTTALAAIALRSEIASIGVDLEYKTRQIKVGSERFFINDEDEFLTEELLLKWCIKEACFKALSNSGEKIELLKQVVIKKDHFYFEDQKTVSLNRYTIIEDQDKYIVLAICDLTEKLSVELVEKRNT